MSKERELLKMWVNECMWRGSNMSLLEETKEFLAQPEEEGVYQKILRIEDGIEVEILPSELWLDGYETGRKDPQKRESLGEEEAHVLCQTRILLGGTLLMLLRDTEKAHGIGV